jgi:alkanesulfonate monooxygenase SsuD/methylene tetrahydromethanopterin reductase-like flavin-dependent oxidoreductase (luciferase family)
MSSGPSLADKEGQDDIRHNLGFYALAGAPRSPRELIGEMQDGERLGFGWAFISERLNIKEAATLCGAAAAVSSEISIATAATNHTTRHPLVTAAYAMTMHQLSGGRFTLGVGRGVDALWKRSASHPSPSRRWNTSLFSCGVCGEARPSSITRPAGRYPLLRLGSYGEEIPIGLVAFGPNSLKLGGRAFDQVVLHTFFTDETTVRCVNTVKGAAERAGRDPADVKVWACLARIGAHVSVILHGVAPNDLDTIVAAC